MEAFAGREVGGVDLHGLDEFRRGGGLRDLLEEVWSVGETMNAGGVGEELVEGDVLGIGDVWEVFVERVYGAEFPGFRQFQNGGGGELFGDGADAEFGGEGGGDFLFDIGQAKAAIEDDPFLAPIEHHDAMGVAVGEASEILDGSLLWCGLLGWEGGGEEAEGETEVEWDFCDHGAEGINWCDYVNPCRQEECVHVRRHVSILS